MKSWSYAEQIKNRHIILKYTPVPTTIRIFKQLRGWNIMTQPITRSFYSLRADDA